MKKFSLIVLTLLFAIAPLASAYYTPDGVDVTPTGITYEGATKDAFETSVVVTDPTADRTVTYPDADVDLTGNLVSSGIDTSAKLAAIVTDETGTGALVLATTPTLVTPEIGAATATSVTASTIALSDGLLDGVGAVDLDIGSADVTDVTVITDGGTVVLDGSISSDANDLAWSVVAGANTACTTTCTFACVFGVNTAATEADIVDCADATADECLCAGAS